MTGNIVKNGTLEEDKFQQYRKKPVVVEAYKTDKELEIETLEGTMRADIGDYVIKGVHGEPYPCKPDIFHKTYEKVEEITRDGNQWHRIIRKQHNLRKETIETELAIQEAMTNYLKTIAGNDDFNLRYESIGAVKLHCNGDLFDLVQIGDFCEVFNLDICITNRVVVENYMEDTTETRTNYLFTTKPEEE